MANYSDGPRTALNEKSSDYIHPNKLTPRARYAKPKRAVHTGGESDHDAVPCGTFCRGACVGVDASCCPHNVDQGIRIRAMRKLVGTTRQDDRGRGTNTVLFVERMYVTCCMPVWPAFPNHLVVSFCKVAGYYKCASAAYYASSWYCLTCTVHRT